MDMFGKIKDSVGQAGSTIGSHSKKGVDATWKGLDKYVGEPLNALSGKLGAEAFWPTSMDKECEKAARTLRTFTSDGLSDQELSDEDKSKSQEVLKKIPQEALRDAKGVAIFTVFRTGFWWSGSSGSGVVMAKQPDGSWSAPSGILIHTIGFGFLVGIDIYDVVLILRNDRALNSFKNPKVTLGGEVSAAAGPVGAGGSLESGIEAAPCWSYTKSKGFYAGVQLDGTVIIERNDENERFYGRKLPASQILEGRVSAPADADGLMQTLYAAEGNPKGTDNIPQGPSPSDANQKVPQSEEEAKQMAEKSSQHD